MTYAACILWTILVAIASAANDAERIALNEKIHHVRAWFIRAALVAAVCVAAELPLMVVPMGALFSMAFRFTLNDVRDLDWRYVSPSSWYDYGYLMATGAWSWKESRWTWRNWMAMVSHTHWINYDLNPPYVQQVHRAGLLAYIAEAVVVLIFAVFV